MLFALFIFTWSDNSAGDTKKPQASKGSLLTGDKDTAEKIGDIFDSLDSPINKS